MVLTRSIDFDKALKKNSSNIKWWKMFCIFLRIVKNHNQVVKIVYKNKKKVIRQ